METLLWYTTQERSYDAAVVIFTELYCNSIFRVLLMYSDHGYAGITFVA
jgi:hypothetical protein